MPSTIDFRRVFETAPGLFLLLRPDRDFTIAGASDEYLRATFTEREAIVGRELFDVFPDNPDDPKADGVEKLRASLERVMASKAADHMATQKYDVRRPESLGGGFVERYWSPVNAPVLSDDGAIELIVHRVEDATETVRIQRLEARERANLRASEILDSITEGFFGVDRDWRFTYVNKEAQRIHANTPDDLLGKVMWEQYPGLVGSVFEPVYRDAMDRGIPGSITSYYPDHDRWYEVHAYPAPDGVSIYFRNVTEKARAEEERLRLEAESEKVRRIYEAALSNTPDLIYVFDLQHRFIYANEALLKMWGRTPQESFGRTCLELGYEPWHAAMHDREIEQVVATRAPIRGEVPFTGTEGRRVYDYIFVPVLGRDGAVVAVAGSTRDFTERKKAEEAIRGQAERLREADRAKDEFLATLSHELRNPLAPLRNSLYLLRLGDQGATGATPIHEMMERQLNHLVRLVDDLLEMSRISRGTLDLRRERVEVGAIIRNAVETSSPLIKEGKHDLQVTTPYGPLWVDGDPVRLAQILSNLLNNAAKYIEAGGHIQIEAVREGESVAITVRDDGPGIEPEMVPRLFAMFTRGARATARGQNGLGIGLALARRLAQMHGGDLTVANRAGGGAEFTLRVALAATREVAPAPRASDGPAIPPLRILLVDDNRDAGESLGMILETLGAAVKLAHDGPEALTRFRECEPDVVLLDIGMPGMDGYEVARTLRQRHPDAGTAIVALTGWGQDEDRKRARDAGFDHHLVKPVDLLELRKLLASLKVGVAGD